jgi:hypothetical protein
MTMRRRAFLPRLGTGVALALALLAPRAGGAYEAYKMSGSDTTRCGNAACHGNFLDSGLHDMHQGFISACRTCHVSGSRYPEFTMYSGDDGNGGADGYGCAGCHGNDYGETVERDYGAWLLMGKPKMSSYGLRKRHAANGVTVCAGCHAEVCVLPESAVPYYYTTPVSLVTNPCDAGNEDRNGSRAGLDNDGDTVRDANDPDCSGCVDKDNDGWGDPGSASCPNGARADCDDCDPAVNGGVASESGPTCTDGKDNDCDTLTDAADPDCGPACNDQDGDGYGDPGDPSCPNGAQRDCDDGDRDVNPGVPFEAGPTCTDGKDNDCDGLTDGQDPDCITGDDTDGDTVPDAAPDNCVLVWNPNQADGDGDGIGSACDPDDEVIPVRASRGTAPAGTEVVLTWDATPGPPRPEYTRYNVYRAPLATLQAGTPASPNWAYGPVAACSCIRAPIRECRDPAAGDGGSYYYIVAGWAVDGEGAYGWADVPPLGVRPGVEDPARDAQQPAPVCP